MTNPVKVPNSTEVPDPINVPEGFIGEIRLFATARALTGWLICDGRELQIADYKPLYSIIGDSFSADSATATFKIPDLRGKVVIGAGPAYNLGAAYGSDTATIEQKNIPGFMGAGTISRLSARLNKTVFSNPDVQIAIPCDDSGDQNLLTANPENAYFAKAQVADGAGGNVHFYSHNNSGSLHPFVEQLAVTSHFDARQMMIRAAHVQFKFGNRTPSPVSIRQPSLSLQFAICYMGIYPDFSDRRADAQTNHKSSGSTKLANSTTKTLEVVVNHHLNLPVYSVHLSVANADDYEDAFVADVVDGSISSNSFKAIVCRVDGTGWGQNPILHWTITAFDGL